MNLTESQKNSLLTWVQEGRSLAEVQRLLREEFKISMTYMDVRFLIDDLNVPLVDRADEARDDGGLAVRARRGRDAELVRQLRKDIRPEADEQRRDERAERERARRHRRGRGRRPPELRRRRRVLEGGGGWAHFREARAKNFEPKPLEPRLTTLSLSP